MIRKTRIAMSAVIASLAMTLVMGVVPASATRPTGHKVTICHATFSVKNPYVEITIDIAAAGYPDGSGGHASHTGPIPTSPGDLQDFKDAGTPWGDVIPEYDYQDFHFDGLNVSAEGLALLESGCVVPDLPPRLVRYTLVRRMPSGTLSITLEAGLVPSITCDTATNEYVVTFSDGTEQRIDVGTSRKGSILRVRSGGVVLVAVRASEVC